MKGASLSIQHGKALTYLRHTTAAFLRPLLGFTRTCGSRAFCVKLKDKPLVREGESYESALERGQ
jgi:hypothetical protein